MLIMMCSLCSCRDYREINDDSIVAGFALDIGQNGNTLLTIEFVDFSDSQDGGGGRSQKITVEGESLVDAVSHGFSESSEYLYWNHTAAVVVSSEYAKRGIAELLDYIYRNSGITLSTNILVSDLGSAKEVLELDTNNSAIKSYAIRNILSDGKYFEGIKESNAYGVINDLVNEGIHPAISVVTESRFTEKKSIAVEGTAIFFDDKLLGFADPEDTAYIRILKNELHDGFFDFTVDDSNISCLIRDAKTELKPAIEDGKLRMDVSFSAGYEIIAQNGSIDLSEKRVMNRITDIITEEMRNRIKNVAEEVRDEFGSDIFGFGAVVKRKMPKLFKELDWDEYFKCIEIRTEVKIDEPHEDDQYPSVFNLKSKEKR